MMLLHMLRKPPSCSNVEFLSSGVGNGFDPDYVNKTKIDVNLTSTLV